MWTGFEFDEVLRDLDRAMRRLWESADEFRDLGEEDREDSEMEQKYHTDEAEYTFERGLHPEPFEPIEPLFRRKPRPGRFGLSESVQVTNEPLVDIIDRGDVVKVYVELPPGVNDDVQLSVTKGGIEVKADGFYRTVHLPIDVDVERSSSRLKNRVLEVTIPKRERYPEGERHRIEVEQPRWRRS